MQLHNRNILIISPERWDHIFVSKHHYAVCLGKRGNKVFFLNPPGRNVDLSATQYKNVYQVDYRGFPKGIRFYPGWLQRRIIAGTFRRISKLCGVAFDVLWSFDNSVFYDFRAFPREVLKISHIVDLNQNFQTRIAASTADVCLCTTEQIRERLLNFSTRVVKINHGFNEVLVGEENAHLRSPCVTALYSGNLAMPYIDWMVIAEMVRGNPNVAFVFVGPNGDTLPTDPAMAKAKREVRECPHVRFIGPVDASLLQQHYRAADILLIAYHERYHREQANPHKMMEYLGSGKIVVASFTSEYDNLSKQGLIVMTRRNKDLPEAFRETLNRLSLLNSAEYERARVRFALEHTYERQIEKIEEVLRRLTE